MSSNTLETPTEPRLLGPDAVREKYFPSMSRQAFYSAWREGKLPRPIRLSPRRNVWNENVLRAWIEQKTREAMTA